MLPVTLRSKPLATHLFPLDSMPEALEMQSDSHEIVKALVNP